MDVNRREVIGILTAGAASVSVAEAQAPPPAPPNATLVNADGDVQAARLGLKRDAQRIAMITLPPTTEPAFRFRP
jgi:hypothetical protein